MIVSATGLTTRSDDYVAGGKFTANSNVTVTAIGVRIVPGATNTHWIGIFTSGSYTLIAQTNVSYSGLSGMNYWTLTTPVSLTAGTTYSIFAENGHGDSWYEDTATLTTAPEFTLGSSYYQGSAWPPSGPSPRIANAMYGYLDLIFTNP